MDNLYRVPKRKIPAEIRTERGRQRVHLFLSERAACHSGPERPSDLLNDGAAFVPVEDESGAIALLRRESPIAVTVAADHEQEKALASSQDIPPELFSVLRVAVLLDDGSALEGSVRYQLPDGHSRLQDYLNEPSAYLPLYGDDERLTFVNKRRIVRVTLL